MGRISREIARDMQHRTEAAIEGELAKRPPVMHFPRTLPWLVEVLRRPLCPHPRARIPAYVHPYPEPWVTEPTDDSPRI